MALIWGTTSTKGLVVDATAYAAPLLPGPEETGLQDRHVVYQQLYPALNPLFSQISRIQP
ncbi:hypothetical protein ACLM44_08330 [Synechococcus sp. W2B2]|uniref:hypothetical protein n=1 Tax=unclassified Synechococcus TaxID=2626047 RepID=UPI000324A9B8|nr:hypothetical protein [Synechococcus sp. WH 7805]